ncbi:unnamed protein product, partial [Ectocarpus sp. 8 AP-2014]
LPHSLTGEEIITRVGAFKDDEGKVHLIPDPRMNTLGKYRLVPGEMDNPPKEKDVMGPLLAEFIKKGTPYGLESQMRDTLVRASRTRSGSAPPATWSAGKGSCLNLNVLSDSDRGTDDGLDSTSDSSSSDEHDGDQEEDSDVEVAEEEDSDVEVAEEEDSDVYEVDEENDKGGGSMSQKSGKRKGATSSSTSRATAASTREASKHPGAASAILNLTEDRPAGRPAREGSSKRAAAGTKNTTSKRAGEASAPVDLASDNSKNKEGSADGGKGKKGKAKKGKAKGGKAKAAKCKEAKDKGEKGLMHARLTENREEKAALDAVARITSRKAEEERQTAYKASLEAERVRGSRAKAIEARAHKGIEEAKQAAQVATKNKSDARRKQRPAKKDTDAETSPTTARPDHASASTGSKRKVVTPPAPPVVSEKKEKKEKKHKKGSQRDAKVETPVLDPAQIAALMQMMQHINGGASSSGPVPDASSDSDSDSDSGKETAHDGDTAEKDEDDYVGAPVGARIFGDDPELEHFRACVDACRFGAGTVKDMREWNEAHLALKRTRKIKGRPNVSLIQATSKNEDGSVTGPLVPGCSFPTARRWRKELAAVNVCHGTTCCDESTPWEEATEKHLEPDTPKPKRVRKKSKNAKRVAGAGGNRGGEGKEKGRSGK